MFEAGSGLEAASHCFTEFVPAFSEGRLPRVLNRNPWLLTGVGWGNMGG